VAGTPSQVGDGGARRRVGQHPEAEGQRGWRNVEASLDGDGGRDGGQVLLGELPVRVAPPVRPVPQRRQQAEILAVAEHPRGHAEPRGGLSNAHGYQSNILLSKIPAGPCAMAGASRSVVLAAVTYPGARPPVPPGCALDGRDPLIASSARSSGATL
jgi:hypothetical protein